MEYVCPLGECGLWLVQKIEVAAFNFDVIWLILGPVIGLGYTYVQSKFHRYRSITKIVMEFCKKIAKLKP